MFGNVSNKQVSEELKNLVFIGTFRKIWEVILQEF